MKSLLIAVVVLAFVATFAVPVQASFSNTTDTNVVLTPVVFEVVAVVVGSETLAAFRPLRAVGRGVGAVLRGVGNIGQRARARRLARRGRSCC